jgi:hypothetical protein
VNFGFTAVEDAGALEANLGRARRIVDNESAMGFQCSVVEPDELETRNLKERIVEPAAEIDVLAGASGFVLRQIFIDKGEGEEAMAKLGNLNGFLAAVRRYIPFS